MQRWSLALMFLAGLFLGLIHAPYSLPYLGILALPFAAKLAGQTSHKLWSGYLLGLGYFAITMSWISEPFSVGPPAYAWMGYPAWILMSAGLALFWIPVFLFSSRGIWTIALLLGIMEYLRGHIFTGLPWGLFAYGFIDTPFASFASVIGVYALTVWIALAAILLANFRAMPNIITALILILIPIIFAYFRPAPDVDSFADINAQIVQPNFTIDDRRTASPVAQIDTLLALSQGDASIIVWPEGSTLISPTYDPELLPYIQKDLKGKTLIFGAPSFDNDLYFNSAYELRPDGRFYRYDKIHPVPFGEYIPFGDWLLSHGIAVETVNQFNTRKGRLHPYPDFASPRPNILICYEGIFPKLGRREGDYLVLITNDNWFGTRSGPKQHLDIARFRAIENGLPLLRAALTGISAIIDAQGQITASIPLNQQDAVSGALGASYASTIYRRIRDWPVLIFFVFGIAYLVATRRRSIYSSTTQK